MTDALHALRSLLQSTSSMPADAKPADDSMLLVCAAPQSVPTLTRSVAHQELQRFGAVHTIEHASAPNSFIVSMEMLEASERVRQELREIGGVPVTVSLFNMNGDSTVSAKQEEDEKEEGELSEEELYMEADALMELQRRRHLWQDRETLVRDLRTHQRLRQIEEEQGRLAAAYEAAASVPQWRVPPPLPGVERVPLPPRATEYFRLLPAQPLPLPLPPPPPRARLPVLFDRPVMSMQVPVFQPHRPMDVPLPPPPPRHHEMLEEPPLPKLKPAEKHDEELAALKRLATASLLVNKNRKKQAQNEATSFLSNLPLFSADTDVPEVSLSKPSSPSSKNVSESSSDTLSDTMSPRAPEPQQELELELEAQREKNRRPSLARDASDSFVVYLDETDEDGSDGETAPNSSKLVAIKSTLEDLKRRIARAEANRKRPTSAAVAANVAKKQKRAGNDSKKLDQLRVERERSTAEKLEAAKELQVEKELQAVKAKVLQATKDKKLQAAARKAQAAKEKELKAAKERELQAAKEKELQEAKERVLQAAKEKELQAAKEKELQEAKERELQAAKEKELQAIREKELQEAKERELQAAREKELQEAKERELQAAREKELQAAKLLKAAKERQAKQEREARQKKREAAVRQRLLALNKLQERSDKCQRRKHELGTRLQLARAQCKRVEATMARNDADAVELKLEMRKQRSEIEMLRKVMSSERFSESEPTAPPPPSTPSTPKPAAPRVAVAEFRQRVRGALHQHAFTELAIAPPSEQRRQASLESTAVVPSDAVAPSSSSALYTSPLRCLRAYRLITCFDRERAACAFRADVDTLLCTFDLLGQCNDESCAGVHIRNLNVSGAELGRQLRAYLRVLSPDARLSPDATPEQLMNAIRACEDQSHIASTAAIAMALHTDDAVDATPRAPETAMVRTKGLRSARKSLRARPTPEDDDVEMIVSDALSEGEVEFLAFASDSDGDAVDVCGNDVQRDSCAIWDALELLDEASETPVSTATTISDDTDSRYFGARVATSTPVALSSQAAFESALAEASSDVGLWLQYARWQASESAATAPEAAAPTNDSHWLDPTLHVLSRAVEANPRHPAVWRSYLGLFEMRSAASTVGTGELRTLLCSATHYNPLDMTLWRRSFALASTHSTRSRLLQRALIAHTSHASFASSTSLHESAATLLVDAARLHVSAGRADLAQALLERVCGILSAPTRTQHDSLVLGRLPCASSLSANAHLYLVVALACWYACGTMPAFAVDELRVGTASVFEGRLDGTSAAISVLVAFRDSCEVTTALSYVGSLLVSLGRRFSEAMDVHTLRLVADDVSFYRWALVHHVGLRLEGLRRFPHCDELWQCVVRHLLERGDLASALRLLAVRPLLRKSYYESDEFSALLSAELDPALSGKAWDALQASPLRALFRALVTPDALQSAFVPELAELHDVNARAFAYELWCRSALLLGAEHHVLLAVLNAYVAELQLTPSFSESERANMRRFETLDVLLRLITASLPSWRLAFGFLQSAATAVPDSIAVALRFVQCALELHEYHAARTTLANLASCIALPAWLCLLRADVDMCQGLVYAAKQVLEHAIERFPLVASLYEQALRLERRFGSPSGVEALQRDATNRSLRVAL